MAKSHKLLILAAAATALFGSVALTTTPALAVDSAASAIEARKAIFKRMESNMRPLAAIARGRAPADKATMERHSAAIASAARQISGAFRTNTASSSVETEAKDSIWSNKADFDAKAARLVTASNTLSTAASSGDAARFRTALVAVGQACKDCHDSYRTK